MVQGYYTLQEAAQALGMAPEELKAMAQRNQIRSFQDRGTWRFRIQDIQELARQRGAASDMDLVLGEAAARSPQPKSPGPKSPPRPAPRTPQVAKSGPKSPAQQSPRPKSPEVFDFAVDSGQEADFGLDLVEPGSVKKPDSKKPTPKPGSDSDVRLVSEGGGDVAFAVGGEAGDKPSSDKPDTDSDVKLVGQSDSDVKIVPDPAAPRTPKVDPGARRSGPAGSQATPPVAKRPSKVVPPPATPDSGVRLVPMDSDSDVKIVGAAADADVPLGESAPKQPTDSDIRLESAPSPMDKSDEGMLTEEINLDEELRKQEALSKQKPQAKVKPKSKPPKFPQSSPFEIGDTDLLEPAAKAPAKPAKPDSSDYDLTPDKPSDSSSDYDLQLKDSSDELAIESATESLKGPSSGISITNPKDGGISLEQGEVSDEFELNVQGGESTPKPPKPAPEVADSDSEFELSLDVDDSGTQTMTPSDSEFELTLDDSVGLAPEEPAPQLKAGGGEKDIFETDFEVPSLEDESGSQVAALDTDLDSSDFDLAISDSEIAVEDESGSQVVALDEEEADDAAATIAAKRKAKRAAVGGEEVGEEDFGAIEEEEAVVEEEEVVVQKVVKPAPWGALPALVMLPCVVVMMMVGMMGFELLQSSTGYKPPGMVTKTIGELMGQKMK